MCKMSMGVVALLLAGLAGPACSSRSGLRPAGGTAGAGGTANGGHALGGVGGTNSVGGVAAGGVSGAGASGTSTCLVTECPVREFCVPAGQPRANLCGCPIPDCEPDGGVGGSAGTGAGGAFGTGGTGSEDCIFVDGGTLPAIDQVTGFAFTAPPTIPNDPPRSATFTTNKAQAQDVYQATLALPVLPSGIDSCFWDTVGMSYPVTYQLTFSLANGNQLTVMADPGSCPYVVIPGTCVRSPDLPYWTRLADDIGIPVSWIYPLPNIPVPIFVVPDGGTASPCVKDVDCPAGLSCGYPVADGCAAKGVCVQSNCQKGACLTPAGMCGCDGQTILPVQSQQLSPNSSTIVYASAPSSGKIGPCTGIVDAGSPGCTWQGKVIPVGQQVDAGDGCNICECAVAGIACTARACFPPDAPTLVCSLPYALTFGSDGGMVSVRDSFALDTAGHMTVTRNYFSSMDGPTFHTCSGSLPACGASGVVSISTIAQDLTDADVQFAFGLTTSHVYGVDQRPVDGSVWSVTRASGGNILVGSPCPLPNMNSCQPIPAGIQRLADDLRSLAFTAETSGTCMGL